jgi:hypothetical protein
MTELESLIDAWVQRTFLFTELCRGQDCMLLDDLVQLVGGIAPLTDQPLHRIAATVAYCKSRLELEGNSKTDQPLQYGLLCAVLEWIPQTVTCIRRFTADRQDDPLEIVKFVMRRIISPVLKDKETPTRKELFLLVEQTMRLAHDQLSETARAVCPL